MTPRRILVVEDDAICREEVRLLLTEWGHDVHAVGDNSSALAVLSTDLVGFDLILLDLNTPGISPEEFRYAISADPRAADIPLVIVSGDRSLHRRAHALGARGHLKKPFSLEELEDALRFCPHHALRGSDTEKVVPSPNSLST